VKTARDESEKDEPMSAIFGGDEPPPVIQMPPPASPAPVPRADQNDPANREVRRRAIEALASGGRRSTLLSPPKPRPNTTGDGSGTPNFDSYAATRLGTGA
jgi:hypothetical protein